MKIKLFFALICFYCLTPIRYYSQSCTFPSAWYSNLQSKSYTYTFDWGSISLSMFPNETNLNTVKSNIRSNIFSALGSWGGAAGISFSYVGDYQSADLSVEFTDLSGKAGDVSYYPLAIIFDTSVDFTFSQSQYYFTFSTVAFHEAGRLFHGTDHPNYDDDTSATIECYPNRSISSISSCDAYAMNTLYYYTASYNNEFETGLTGGDMTVNGTTTTLPSGGSSTTWHKNDPTRTLAAVDQTAGTYYRLFDNWNDGEYSTGTINVAKTDKYYKAKFKKRFEITYDGSVTISYITYSPNEVYYTKENNSFSAYANPKVVNSMYEVLSSWKLGNDVLGYDNPHSFSPNNHTNYTIIYSVQKPTNDYRNQHFNDTVGACVKVKWDKHPLDNSQIKKYSIFRKVRHNGVTGNEVQIGTVTANGSSNYSFVDNDYIITSGYTDLLFYDVRAFYDPDNDGTGVYSDADFISIFGELFSINQNSRQLASALNSEKPENYSLSNYPNPFNPSTTINYELPENGFVTIKVFDMLGKELATLVNENKSAGYYNVNFDASKLTSGVYIYTISANGFIQSKKMLLVK